MAITPGFRSSEAFPVDTHGQSPWVSTGKAFAQAARREALKLRDQMNNELGAGCSLIAMAGWWEAKVNQITEKRGTITRDSEKSPPISRNAF